MRLSSPPSPRLVSLSGRHLPAISLLITLVLVLTGLSTPATAADPHHRTWVVAGVEREALVYLPASRSSTAPASLVFVFHGHGGTMAHAARRLALHHPWPEAIVVYPQGLPTPGRLTDPQGKKSGWQSAPGAQDDRDLAFVDTLIADLRATHAINPRRIYATGHSNGGGFTYLLWHARPHVFAAFAPVAATPDPAYLPRVPRPVFHVAGHADRLVKFAWQRRSIDFVRRLNSCADTGTPWPAAPDCTLYPSSQDSPVVTFVHPGGHEWPAPASARIAAFFRQHPRSPP